MVPPCGRTVPARPAEPNLAKSRVAAETTESVPVWAAIGHGQGRSGGPVVLLDGIWFSSEMPPADWNLDLQMSPVLAVCAATAWENRAALSPTLGVYAGQLRPSLTEKSLSPSIRPVVAAPMVPMA